MSNQDQSKSHDDNSYFGSCPECLDMPLILNIGRNHSGTCEKHMAKWQIGSNMFSGWKDEEESNWQKNATLLKEYAEIEPYYNAPRASAMSDENAALKAITENLIARRNEEFWTQFHLRLLRTADLTSEDDTPPPEIEDFNERVYAHQYAEKLISEMLKTIWKIPQGKTAISEILIDEGSAWTPELLEKSFSAAA